jgi:hypothetical protein
VRRGGVELVAEQLEERMVDVAEPLRTAFIAYLQRKSATCRPKTVSSLATRLAHFGRFLADIDPELASLAALDRRRHIEPFITSLVEATNTVTGEPITVANRRAGRRMRRRCCSNENTV